jgi:hypothetical protein
MCDVRTFNRIERCIRQRMAEGRMFTAFDITLDLRKKGSRRPHREIRRDIKSVADSMIYLFDYERTRVRFRETGAEAFVYHPYGTDADRHQPSVRPLAFVIMRRDGGVN